MNESFKKTEAGVIPVDWSCQTIGEIAYVGRGRVISHREISHALSPNYPVYSSQTSNNGVMGYLDTYDFDGKYVTWTTDGVNAGTVFYRSGKFSCTNVCGTIKPIEQNTSYVALVLSQRTNRYVSRNLANPKLMNDVMKQIAIALPSNVNEQHEIATAITEADELISSLDQLIAKKRDIQQAAMQQLLTGQRRLPGFSSEWEVRPFNSIFQRINVKGHQIQASDYQSTGKYPVVDQGKDLIVGFSDNEEKRFINTPKGVIVFGDHTCIVKFVDFDFLVGADGTQVLQAMEGQNTRFHAFQLQYRGIEPTGYNRHFKFLKERFFQEPPLDEQTAIATVLSDMEAELAALESRRDKAQQIKQGMMQELLTGRIRLA